MSSNPLPRPSAGDQADTTAVRSLALIEALRGPGEITRAERVYVNRNLKLDQVQVVGFDMDYTLALYHQDKMEELSVLTTLHKLVVNKGYPEQIRELKYDPSLAMRGLMVDQQLGNVFKPDRYGAPGRALHGQRALSRADVATAYHQHRLRLGDEIGRASCRE